MKSRLFAAIFLLMSGITPSAQANDNKQWANISDIGVIALAGTALALPAVREDWQGFRQAGYSLVTAEGVAILGKAVIHERRPDRSDNNSFPSGHASLAFASATTLHRRYGWQTGAPAYALATLTAYARVDARKHHWYDVVAGALIGTSSGWFFTDAFNSKVQLVPWADSKSAGVQIGMQW
ncbi:phosphatase PAP2 family protein [Candidatus Nitrotoga sp. M5]|uniref:phosphatase PAP2 family protein n=1 Tax=Candidatus Nitrotoga sp. M5 TaxID=2890409 RepID=UPI001EF33DC7|nr:phosphatase PAP2 family protein [Candidatus Nitrotoga sp. M5]